MKTVKKYRIIIGGGGTGGHVFPAISIANALKQQLEEVSFLFVGALGKLEMEKIPEAGYEVVGLPVAGFQRKISWKNITFFFKLLRSMAIARKLIKKYKPDIAIGVGGYASGPIVKAAARKKIPVLIQEQNSFAGVTNRMLAKSAQKICVAYKGMEKYFPAESIVFTGNPIRQDIILPEAEKVKSYNHFGLKPDKKVILLIGGSLGANTLNESVFSHVNDVMDSDVQLLWQCGRIYYDKVKSVLESQATNKIVLVPFISEMNRAFQVADLIISRAGAGTISELCIVGKPVILVPSPNVAADHQTSNAKAITDQESGVLIADKDAKSDLFRTALELIKDEKKMNMFSRNIKKLAMPDASERIAKEVIKILECR